MANAKESLGTLEFQLNLLPQAIPDLQEAQQLYRELDRPDKADAVGRTLQEARAKQGDQYIGGIRYIVAPQAQKAALLLPPVAPSSAGTAVEGGAL
jgi:hypothetical protein